MLFGVTGVVLDWLSSYLSEREQRVLIEDTTSDSSSLLWGVPQGSIIGPLLFICYTAPIQDIIQAHGFSTMIYADDTQLYVSMKVSQRDQVMEKLESCLQDVRDWMHSNQIILNDNKMEILHVSSNFRPCKDLSPIVSNGVQVQPSASVRDLVVIIDKHLSMREHINVCRKATLALRRIGKIFVSSLLDNCNSLLFGVPDKDLSKLQRIQNSAARLVSRSKKQNHITPILRTLHWLPTKSRI